MSTPNRRRSTSVTVRLTAETSDAWHAAARAEGCSLTEWLERAGRARIERQAEVLEVLRSAQIAVAEVAPTTMAVAEDEPAAPQVDEWQWAE